MRNSFSSSTTTGYGEASSSASSSSTAVSSSVNPSPSFARRRALKEADTANQLRVVDSYPLSKYMIIAQRLFGYFQQAFENLNLDEAYVYGMRFAQLGLTNLPKHREWTTGGNAEENLKSQIAKALSRLEIIKRRMDDEESMKLRVRMLAQAEEEIRKQNQFHHEQREQEQHNALEEKRYQLNQNNNSNDVYRYDRKDEKLIATTMVEAKVGAMEEFVSSIESNSATSNQTYTDDGSHSGSFRNINITPALRGDAKIHKSTAEKAKKKLRKLLGIPKKSKWASNTKTMTTTAATNNNIENSTSSTESGPPVACSQTILPSLSAIRQSRAQHELQGNKANPTVVETAPTTHYTIEQYPMNEEVTLKLQSTQTPSLLNLQYAPASYDNTTKDSQTHKERYVATQEEDNRQERTINLPAMEGSVSMSLSPQTIDITSILSNTTESMPRNTDNEAIVRIVTTDEVTNTTLTRDTVEDEKRALNNVGFIDADAEETMSLSSCSKIFDTKDRILTTIAHRLLSNHSDEDRNRYELVMSEMRKKVSSMYTGHHGILDPHCECCDRSIENDVFEDDVKSTKIENMKILPNFEIVRDQASATNKGKNNETLLNSFDSFDAFLSKKVQIDKEEESYTEFTVIEEETGETEFAASAIENDTEDEESYIEYILEEEVEDDESYMEYTVADESVQLSDVKKAEATKASEHFTSSPTCVASDKIISLYNPHSRPSGQIPKLDFKDENLDKFPTMNIAVPPAIDDDNMTYITMDPWLEGIDTVSQGSSSKYSKQRIKVILHKDLWKRDISIVEAAIEELNEVVNSAASSRAHVAECGGIMAIIRTMSRFPKNEGIQFLCCSTLGQLASEPETQAMINDMDAVPLISRSMTDHPGSQRIQDAARATIATVYSR